MIWGIHFIMVNFLLLLGKLIHKRKIFIYGSFIYAMFVFGQRWMVGTDFPNYLNYYLLDYTRNELLYFGIQKVFTSLNLYFGLFVFIMFFISLSLNYVFILKFKNNAEWILYLYLFSEIFFAQMSQIRQFIAISFFINAYFYFFEGKKWQPFVMVFLGSMFHISALFMLPFLFIKLRVNRLIALYFLAVAAILPLFNLSSLFRLPIFSSYSNYVGGLFDVHLSPFHYIKFYILLVFIVLVIWNLEKDIFSNKMQLILNGIIFYMVLYGASFQFAILMRVSFYFKIFEVVFLVMALEYFKFFSKYLYRLMVVALFLLTFTGFALTDPYNISPYQIRILRLTDNRSPQALRQEIIQFHRMERENARN